ncbi:hypothetical protein V1514DRAFT_200566 [Lipomyces japonicus]|uniref:uncharacterized protein n=1 Tax=Lipomyces japonicus TaxID=56871 RepID=UPI0034CDD3BC
MAQHDDIASVDQKLVDTLAMATTPPSTPTIAPATGMCHNFVTDMAVSPLLIGAALESRPCTSSDCSASSDLSASTVLSTPISTQSNASYSRSTPSTPYRSAERFKSQTAAVAATKDDFVLNTTHPVFSLAADRRRHSLSEGGRHPFDAEVVTDVDDLEDGVESSPSALSSLLEIRSEDGKSDVSMIVDSSDRPHPSACLFVASLPSSHSLERLRDAVISAFAEWNPIDVTAHRDSSDRPYAFVQLRSYEDARDALQARRGSVILDRPIRCEHARVNRALFLASVSKTLNRLDAENFFKKFGELEFLICANTAYGNENLRGWCAKFEYREDAIDAYFNLKLEEDLIIFYAQNPDPKIPGTSDNNSIFIRNLHYRKVTTDVLEQRFSSYGKIISIEMIYKDSEESSNSPETSCALIKFAMMEEARDAIVNENKTLLFDRRIYICFANLSKVPTTIRLAPAPKNSESSSLDSMNGSPSKAQYQQYPILQKPTRRVLADATNFYDGLSDGMQDFQPSSDLYHGYFPGYAYPFFNTQTSYAMHPEQMYSTFNPCMVSPIDPSFSDNFQVAYVPAQVSSAFQYPAMDNTRQDRSATYKGNIENLPERGFKGNRASSIHQFPGQVQHFPVYMTPSYGFDGQMYFQVVHQYPAPASPFGYPVSMTHGYGEGEISEFVSTSG